MPQAKPTGVQTNLNGGEISPRAMGRFDIAKYANALKRMENFLPLQVGGARFRPGSRYAAETKDSAARSHLIPFQYNTEQGYIIEMGQRYMRFYSLQAQLTGDSSTPIDSATKLLLHFEADLADSSSGAKTITANGNAGYSSGSYKFGSYSCYFDGIGDYLTAADSADWNFSNGDWTIDWWMNPDINEDTNFYCQKVDTSNYVVIKRSSNKLKIECKSGGSFVMSYDSSSSFNPTVGSWTHVAVVRSGTSMYLFINGVSFTLTVNTAISTSSLPDLAAGIEIGSNSTTIDTVDYYTGYIDEYRITKGTARWTANFTPPTAPYGSLNAWATSTAYAVGDLVVQSATTYRCLVAHTSGTFATDLAAAKWVADDAYEIATVYGTSDVADVHYAQFEDVMYLFHRDYQTQKLQRTGSSTFTIAAAPFIRGPFLDTNITSTTITPSAATGTGITLTASTGIFESGHIGSLWRVNTGVVKITGYTSSTVLTGDVQAEPSGAAGTLTGTSAYTDWAEGAFSDVRGYPRTGTFFGQRLVCGGTDYEPQKFFASNVKSYDNFKTDASDTSAAYIYEVSSEQANAMRWLSSSPNALQVGTGGGTISASVKSGTITNANPPDINFDTNYGSLGLQPKRISSMLYYVQKNGYNLRELSYNYLAQRNFAADMNVLADHILRDGEGAYDMEYQQSPQDRIWVVRNDGQLAVLTRNVEQEVMGWSRIVAGDDSTGAGEYESVAVIQNESADDEVWVIVKRIINGSTKRYVEFFTPEEFDDDWDSCNLDSSLTYDTPKTITGATQANPVVITAVAHGFSNGDYVRIDNVVGMTELNGNTYKVAGKTDDTFQLTNTSDANINGSSYGEYKEGGEVREMATAFSGLGHLEGETVRVQADGVALSGNYTVSSGALSPSLTDRAAVVHIGLPYDGTLQLLKPGDINTQFKNRRFFLSSLRIDRSLGFKIGQSEDFLRTVAVGTADGETDPNDGIFYTGDIEDIFTSWWDKQAEIFIKQENPNPLTILAVSLRSEVVEKD